MAFLERPENLAFMEHKMFKLTNKTSLNEIKALAEVSDRLVYGFQTCWWKIGNPVYTIPGSHCLPCGPRSEVLLETDNPVKFIEAAEQNPGHYGKHGLDAFVAAYHGNVVVEETGFPTSFNTWNKYNDLLDQI